ncbi:MerR family transcriptional regulator [Luteimicrobium sp. NPDC057192]|uniref:MerR family transcriptional regulator n=1 Tax=Luteimicrobium sp. NPDC057192 TaxID=3346042 RepID=UPI00363F220C
MSGGDALSTGEMVRASGLSPKALRLYDANGLLAPAFVDPVTGYRAYDAGQVARARAIGLLRRLDLPLARIAELLDGPPEGLRPALLAWWTERRRDLEAQRGVVDLLAGDGEDAAPAAVPAATPVLPDAARLRASVRLVEREARTVACVTDVVEQAALVPAFTSAVLTIREELARQDVVFGPEYVVVFHETVRPGIAGRIETCVPYEGVVRPAGAVALRLEPAGRLASVPVPPADCRYPPIVAYYDAALDAARAWGRPAGPPRERYPVPWSPDVAEVARVEVPLDDA